MQSAEMYDQHVHKYDVDRLAVLSTARATSLAQVDATHAQPGAILDVGCGTGLWLAAAAQRFPGARLVGLDPSHVMLDAAVTRAKIEPLCCDALEAERHLAAGSVDLLAMHFIFAYVSPAAALAQAHRLLTPGGLVSVVSSTYESLANAAAVGESFLSDAQKAETHLPLPATEAALHAVLDEAGFDIVDSQPMSRELEFANYEEFYEFAVPGGWLVQHADILGKFRERPEILASYFPFHDRFRGLAVLARSR